MKRYILLFALISCISFSASAQRRGHGSSGGVSRGGGGYAGHGGSAYHGGGGYYHGGGGYYHGGGGNYHGGGYHYGGPAYRPVYYERPYYRNNIGFGYRGGYFRPFIGFRAPFIYTPSIFSYGIYPYYRTAPVVVYNSNTTVAPNYNQNNNTDFQNLLNNLYSKQYDSDKLAMAKISTMSGNFSSQQVEDIMRSFSNESSRLEYAQFAYGYVIDRANFGIVTNAFMYPTTAQDLSNYIQKYTGH